MAQCFVSTYRNHYRWLDPQITLPIRQEDKCLSAIPPEDIWIGTETADQKLGDDAAVQERIRYHYLKRFITTYQHDYCREMFEELLGKRSISSSENHLLKSAQELYEPKKRPKILPPLDGSRRIYGYIRPSRNYTPLTVYQFFYGRTGYKILQGHFKHGPVDVAFLKKYEELQNASKEEKAQTHAQNTKEEAESGDEKKGCGLKECSCCIKMRRPK